MDDRRKALKQKYRSLFDAASAKIWEAWQYTFPANSESGRRDDSASRDE
jgi:hypothetical protein